MVDKTKRRRYLVVRDQYEGFHKYEDAPAEVAFLKYRHRHMFKWTDKIEVFHDNRELEFFMVKDVIKKEIMPFVVMLDNLGSCEQQAERILDGLLNAYGPDRYYSVIVSEDGENDGEIEWSPDR